MPGTTRKHAPAPATALQKLRPACAGPTRSTLIRGRRLKHRLTTAGTGYHSGSHTRCAVSLTLHYSSHVGRTLSSRTVRHVRGSRLVMVSSATGALISGARIQKRPLTHPEQSFPDSAPSLLRLTGKGFLPLSSLSFSRSAVSAEPRSLSGSGKSVLPPPGSRRQRTFHEPVELCTRSALRLWSVSRGGICSVLVHCAPALNQTAPPICTAESVPLARIRGRLTAMR